MMKSNFPITTLGEHIRQVSQRNRTDTDIEVYSVTNSEGFTKSTDYFSKKVFSKNISNYKIVRNGQFAYNPSRINVGSIDYLRQVSQALVSPLYIVFETDEDLHSDYLLRYLKSDWGNVQIRSHTEGAVRDSLKFKGLGSIKIPLPLLNDQIRISHLLGKLEGMIAQRREHLQQLDALLKSVFLEMFGPLNSLYSQWPVVEIRDLAGKHKGAMRTGPFGSNLLHSEFTSVGDVVVLGIDNAVQNRFNWGEPRFITKEKYKELENYRVCQRRSKNTPAAGVKLHHLLCSHTRCCGLSR
jgi:type I restriction enzyme S subunit